MAATVVRAPAQTAFTSAVISIPAGSVYNFFLYTDAGSKLPATGGGALYINSPTGDLNDPIAELDAEHDYSAAVEGPVDVVVVIPASSVNLGVARFP